MATSRIRMYRVGFGDFFLVTFGDQHVLIDCGVFQGTSGTGDLGSIDRAIQNLFEETNGKLALIVMTHRHADHIAGFGRAADQFADKFCVQAVWMPVWEGEYELAAKLQARLTKVAHALQDHLDLQLASGANVEGQLYHRVGNATGREPELGAAGRPGPTRGRNAVALELLKTRLGVKPEYLSAGDQPRLPAALERIGVSVRVLGPPPIQDIDQLKVMDLERGVGQYLTLAALDAKHGSGTPWQPFSTAWRTAPTTLSSVAFREWMPRTSPAGVDEADTSAAAARARMEAALRASAPEALALAAKKLDNVLNNQSLVLLFTFAGKNLLFAGDAQAGSWEHWLYDTDEATKSPIGPLAPGARAILGSLDVYKVGHHGSTNATPMVVAKELRAGAVALCSTEGGVYGESEHTAVPLTALMNALQHHRTLVRSDAVEIEVEGKRVKTHSTLPEHGDELEPGALWIDYHLRG